MSLSDKILLKNTLIGNKLGNFYDWMMNTTDTNWWVFFLTRLILIQTGILISLGAITNNKPQIIILFIPIIYYNMVCVKNSKHE